MNPKVFIFIGRSGCGKGTQTELLYKYLKENDKKRDTFYIQTGVEFREFIKGDSYTQRLARDIYNKGQLEPEFLSVFMWVNVLINKNTGNENIILDGMPRRMDEDSILDSVFSFYKTDKPFIIHIDISKEESMKRLLSRKRIDDTKEDIEARLAWYETDVVPTLEFYRANKNYRFLEIAGERPIDEIHADIVDKIALGSSL